MVVVPGEAGVPLMLPLLGAVLSVVLGDVVVPGVVVVLGACVVPGVVVLGVVGFGDVVFGLCAPGPGAVLGLVLLPVPPLVCAYTRPAATASATPALAAMVLSLVKTTPVSGWDEPGRWCPAWVIQ